MIDGLTFDREQALRNEVEWRVHWSGARCSVRCEHIPTGIMSDTFEDYFEIHAQTKCLLNLEKKLQS